MAGLEDNKAVVRRMLDEVINAGDMDAFDELVADDYVDLAEGEDPVDRDHYRKLTWSG